jgi:2-polyprenyl-3-methyl-5-hydroxy-6-metoxy-1,4-benzoquinol methylase
LDKSSKLDIALEDQRKSWNTWNRATREQKVDLVSERQAEVILQWCATLGRGDLGILDLGCGSGWMSERLLPFGRVTGVDLADETIERARKRAPQIRFLSGDVFDVDLPARHFDLVISLEVLSHVRDQPAFLERIASLLKTGGHLMLATQNRYVLERCDDIGGPKPGQIRHWVDSRQLRRLLAVHYELRELTSVLPVGNRGALRFVNSHKLNRLLALCIPPRLIERSKERLLLGHTLLALARKRDTETAA